MSVITLHYDVPGDDFTRAGEASGDVKAHLKEARIFSRGNQEYGNSSL